MWFDAFRKDYGPTWYGENRTAVVTDTTTVTIVIVFAIFLVAFLLIFPGIRRERWSSFFSVTLTLSVGAILLVCIHHPCWHVGEVKIHSSYKAFSSAKLDALLGVRVGLKHVNITLRSTNETASVNHSNYHHLNYNERFHFTEVKSMEKELAEGLHKGLPYPILSVIEYLSVDRAGFIWGRQYRLSGYYTCILLWLSFSLWILQVLMLCLVPEYFSRTVLVVGSSIVLADVVYLLSSPRRFNIRFPDAEGEMAVLYFSYGWCLWATIGAGGMCLLLGSVIRILEAKSWYHFVTFLQPDFDEVSGSPRTKSAEPRDRVASHLSLTNAGSLEPYPSVSTLSAEHFIDRPPSPYNRPQSSEWLQVPGSASSSFYTTALQDFHSRSGRRAGEEAETSLDANMNSLPPRRKSGSSGVAGKVFLTRVDVAEIPGLRNRSRPEDPQPDYDTPGDPGATLGFPPSSRVSVEDEGIPLNTHVPVKRQRSVSLSTSDRDSKDRLKPDSRPAMRQVV